MQVRSCGNLQKASHHVGNGIKEEENNEEKESAKSLPCIKLNENLCNFFLYKMVTSQYIQRIESPIEGIFVTIPIPSQPTIYNTQGTLYF